MEAMCLGDEEDPRKLLGLLHKHHLQQQRHLEHLLMRHEQRILDSIGSAVSLHCKQACEQALRCDAPGCRLANGEAAAAAEREGRRGERWKASASAGRGEPVEAQGGAELDKAELRRAGTPEDDLPPALAHGRSSTRPRQTVVDQEQIRELLAKGHQRSWGWSRAASPMMRTSLREHMSRLIASRRFDNLMIALTMLNAIVIAVQVDFVVKQPSRSPPTPFRVLDLLFAVMFTLELCVRLFVDRCRFLHPKHARFTWNLLDLFLVLLVIFDELCQSMSVDTLDVSSAKLVRMLRLARIVRVLRLVREFHDLELMVMGIVSSMKSLVWAVVLLAMIAFMFAAVFMEFVANELISHGINASTQPLLDHFGSLFQSVYTLFKCISGGIDWDDAASPLVSLSPVLGFLFCLFVGFSTFCVLNIITAVFVEHAHRVGVGDEEKLVLQALERRQQQIKEVNRIFACVNKAHDGQLTAKEFKSHLSDVTIQACFARLGITLDDQEMLFELLELDADSNGHVIDVEDLTECIQMVQASASRADVDRLLREGVCLRKQLQDLVEVCRVFAEVGCADHERKAVPAVQGAALARSSCLSGRGLPPVPVWQWVRQALAPFPRAAPAARSIL